jgi:hypothetical protein
MLPHPNSEAQNHANLPQSQGPIRLPLMCYSAQDIESLDRTMDAVVRKAYRLPPGTPTAYLREDLTRGGLGNTSLAVAYTATGIKNLTQAYADEGKRGQLTRALLRAQHTAFTHPLATQHSGWIPEYSLRLRQLLQGLHADIHMWQDGETPFPIPEDTITQALLGTPEAHPNLAPIKKPLKLLHELGITTITQLLNRKHNKVLLPHELLRTLPHPQTPTQSNWKRALKVITTYLTSPPPPGQPTHPTQPTRQHPSSPPPMDHQAHQTRRHTSAPPSYHQGPPRKQPPTSHTNHPDPLRRKRKTRLTHDPEFREMDPTDYTQPHPSAPPPHTQTHPTNDSPPTPHTHPQPLTRYERAQSQLKAGTPPVQVYNELCSFKDSIIGVPGTWRLRTKHTKTHKKARHTLGKQLQWQVLWGPQSLKHGKWISTLPTSSTNPQYKD